MDYSRELYYFATMSKRDAESRRQALLAFMESRKLKPGPWAKSAGVPPTTLYAFLQGRTNDMGAGVYEALAVNAQCSVDELLGNTDEARDRILRAAERLFDERPMEQVTTSAICKAAKVRPTGFLAHFDDPKDVLFDINQQRMRRMLEDVRRLAPVYGTIRDRLAYALRTLAQFELDRPALTRALRAYSFVWSPELEIQEQEMYNTFHKTFVEMLELSHRAGEIKQGNYLIFSKILIAIYHRAQQDALHAESTTEQMLDAMMPQLDLLLGGLGFQYT
ncbi:MAG: TetR/AcrR family transcriptional regulator [Hyphomicrobiaceae bacterium]